MKKKIDHWKVVYTGGVIVTEGEDGASNLKIPEGIPAVMWKNTRCVLPQGTKVSVYARDYSSRHKRVVRIIEPVAGWIAWTTESGEKTLEKGYN